MKFASKSIRTAILTTVLCTGISVVGMSALVFNAAYAADEKGDKNQKLSEKVGKPLNAALEAIKKKQFDVASDRLKDAEAVAKKTPFEQFKINELMAYFYNAQQKYGEVAAAYEKMGETPQWLSPEQNANLNKSIAQAYYNAKQYAKSAEFSKRWLKDHPNDVDIQSLLGQTYYLLKDFKPCRDAMNAAVAIAEKAGQEPKEIWLQVSQSCSIEMNDEAGVIAMYEKLVRYHPKPDHWERLLSRVAANEKSDRAMFQWYRLMYDVGAMKRPDQYKEYAQLAMSDFAMPGEAVRALDYGFSKQILGADAKDKERYERTLTKAKELSKTDKAQLPQLEKEAAASTANGGVDVGLGLAYFSYEQYDQAIPALERGIKKGGLKNPDDAKIALGIAQYKKGQKEQARATFKSIPADSPLAKVSSMWVLRSYN